MTQSNKTERFCNRTSKMSSQCAEQQIWWAKFTNPAIMTSQRQTQLPDCHCDDTEDKTRVPASQNCKLWQPIIKCKTQVVGRLQC